VPERSIDAPHAQPDVPDSGGYRHVPDGQAGVGEGGAFCGMLLFLKDDQALVDVSVSSGVSGKAR
jgi:hypothetical protein